MKRMRKEWKMNDIVNILYDFLKSWLFKEFYINFWSLKCVFTTSCSIEFI